MGNWGNCFIARVKKTIFEISKYINNIFYLLGNYCFMNMLLAVIYNQFRGYFQVNSHTSNKSVTCNQSLRLVKLIKNDRRIRNKSSENILLQGYKWFSLCPIFSLLFLLKKSWKSNTSFSLMAISIQVSWHFIVMLCWFLVYRLPCSQTSWGGGWGWGQHTKSWKRRTGTPISHMQDSGQGTSHVSAWWSQHMI